jgi:hypothetical protein
MKTNILIILSIVIGLAVSGCTTVQPQPKLGPVVQVEYVGAGEYAHMDADRRIVGIYDEAGNFLRGHHGIRGLRGRPNTLGPAMQRVGQLRAWYR